MAELRPWLGVARAPFLLLPVTLVAAGAAAAAWEGTFAALPTLLALVGLIAVHIAVNALNEASDMATGIDLHTRRTPFSGGSGTLPSGQLSVRATRVFAVTCAAIGGLIGVYFALEFGWGLVALMALGVTLAKPVLNRSPVLWSTSVRLLAGLVALVLLTAVSPRHRYLWSTLRPSRSWRVAHPAAVLGAYLAMIVWIAGMKYTQASTASILNQTSTVFVLPLAAVFLSERITLRKSAAVAMALGGAVLVTLT